MQAKIFAFTSAKFHQVIEPERAHIEKDIREANAKVAPLLALVDVAPCKELVGRAERAVLATTCGCWVVELARCPRVEVVREVFSAGLAGGRVEDGEFIPCAFDRTSV